MIGVITGDPLAAGVYDSFHWYFFGAVLVVVAGGMIVSHFRKHQRQRELLDFATGNELFFAPDADDAHSRFDGFEPFGRGHYRCSANLVQGRRGDFEWLLFDHQYITGSGKSKRTHRFGVVAAVVPLHFRRLTIRPEGFLDKMKKMVVGSGDIAVENEQFNRKYHVTCDLPRFALDVLHPQMIELLLAGTPMHWQFRGDVILLHRVGVFSVDEIELAMLLVEGFVDRLPDSVIETMPLHADSHFPLRPAI